MAHVISIFLRRKANSTSSSRVHIYGGATTSAAGYGLNYSLGRLMRKLRKQSKKLCATMKPTTFRFHYDPLSYSKNFDGSGFGTEIDDDSFAHFYHYFSSRFVNCSSSSRMPSFELVSSNNKLEI